MMKEYFPDVVDSGFTADMENQLDNIEKGEVTLDQVLADFWAPFSVQLSRAEEKLREEIASVPAEETDLICDKCGSRMIVKNGRFGKFAACPNYPTCKNTKPLDKDGNLATPKKEEEAEKPAVQKAPDDIRCDICGGEMVVKRSRYGTF